MDPDRMRLNDPQAYRRCEELDLVSELLQARGMRVLELGCGAGWMSRQLVHRFGAASVTATEVDRIQHARILASEETPGVAFRAGGAESIADPDASYDRVAMFKSLHHVPCGAMDQALSEIHRVLVPGGLLYVSEPVYWGDFNGLMSLIQDEREVRARAFEALREAVRGGLFVLEAEVFFESEGHYPDWETFAARFLDVTHRDQPIEAGRRAEIRAAFERHLTPDGARFLKPHRVDLLRRLD